MPLYEYNAVTLAGKSSRGVAYADSTAQLTNRLREDGLFMLSCREQQNEKQHQKLKTKELSEFCRQLGTMLTSGISLSRAMSIISEGDLRPGVQRVVKAIEEDIRRGADISAAMRSQTGAFPELLINMFVAGESNGKLGEAAVKMANHYEGEHRLNNKVKMASTYPVILAVVTVVVMILVFIVVLPQFFELFEGMELPAITRVVLWMSRMLVSHFVEVTLVFVVLGILISFALRMDKVRLWVDRQKLAIPKLGRLYMTIYTARFARTLSSLYLSGLSLLDALEVSRDTMGNRYLASQFDDVIASVRRGENLSSAILRVKGLDIKLAATILVGEESGKLDIMLNSIADTYEYDAETATQQLTTTMEPMLIVIMALIIGTIMVSVMLPIYQLYGNIGA